MTIRAATLASLTPLERSVLQLKALIGWPLSKTDFMDCLNKANLKPSAWNSTTLGPVLSLLTRKGLLASDGSCVPEILHPMAVEAIASANAAVMVEAIAAKLPLDLRSWNDKVIEAGKLRWQRLAVLLNDEKLFEHVTHLRLHYGNRSEVSVFERHFAALDVGDDWFASRLPGFQAAILAAKADRLIATGVAAVDYVRLMELCRSRPALRALGFSWLLDFDLLGAQLSRIDQMLAEPPQGVTSDLPVIFQASRTLLADEPKAAVGLFAQALKLYRKTSRKRKGGLPGYHNLLHICALLAADDPALHVEIEALTETGDSQVGLFALRGLFELARNKPAAARASVQNGLTIIKTMPVPAIISTGLLAVAGAIVDPDMLRPHIEKIFIPLFRRAQTSTPLAATILAEALERAAPNPAIYRAWLTRPENEITFRFMTLIAVKAPWERALESLMAMLSPAPSVAPEAAARNKRLVWLINPDTHQIQPLEQSSQARGWTGGRAVALKRLRQGDPTLDYLDDFDRRASRLITRTGESWREQETFVCNKDVMLPALVGHPRVFDARSPTQPIELVEGRPELVLSSNKSGFRLSFSHAALHEGAFIEIESSGRWRVIVVDAKAIEAAEIVSAQGIAVPRSARDRLAALAQVPTPLLPFRIDTAEIEDSTAVEGDPKPVVRLSPLGDGLKVVVVVRPAGPDGPHFLPGKGGRVVNSGNLRVRRDMDAERRLASALVEACPSLGGEGPEWQLDDLVASLELLDELRALPAPPAMEWPEGQKIALRGEAKLKRLKANIKSGEGWFTLSGSVEVNEDLVLDLQELITRMENMQGRFVPLEGGGFLALDRQFRTELERLSRLGDGLKLPTVAGVVVRDFLDGAGSVKTDARWKAFIQRLDEAESSEPTLAPGFAADLRDYQREGFAWMSRLERWGAGALLADDMGLGKTVQAIAVMAAKAAAGPALVVAPTSVCGNWAIELSRFAPGLRTIRLAESDDRSAAIGALGPGDVLVVSYGLLGREQDRLAAVPFTMAILDEAQAIKNADTQRAAASRRLNAGFRLALTGTPVENDLEELWSLFAFVNPGLLGGRDRFTKRFVTPIGRDNDANAKAALRALVRPFLLRRTKANVLTELPSRTEQTLWIEREPEERAFYEALRRRALERLEEVGPERTRIHILAEITKLRQACCNPSLATPGCEVPSAKLEAFMDLVENLREGRHRALVFSQFVGHLSKMRAALDAKGIVYQYLDGSTPAAEREKRVAAFQAGAGELFLISLKAGGFGLNLTAADYVIHLDPWWNPAVEDQASDRAHRIGQTRPVNIYRLIVKDSIEERIVALHRQKRDLADALLEGADASARLSQDDLIDLIRSGE